MSAKNVDKYNRFRSITVAFRVSPEEQKELNRVNCPRLCRQYKKRLLEVEN